MLDAWRDESLLALKFPIAGVDKAHSDIRRWAQLCYLIIACPFLSSLLGSATCDLQDLQEVYQASQVAR